MQGASGWTASCDDDDEDDVDEGPGDDVSASYQPRPKPSPLTERVASRRRRASKAWLMIECAGLVTRLERVMGSMPLKTAGGGGSGQRRGESKLICALAHPADDTWAFVVR